MLFGDGSVHFAKSSINPSVWAAIGTRAGGEIAFINGILKTLIANDQIDLEFIGKHTARFREFREALQTQSWKMLEQCSGVSRTAMQEFAIQYGAARSAVFVYTGAFTECEFATAKVQAIVNLALARGMARERAPPVRAALRPGDRRGTQGRGRPRTRSRIPA